MTDILTSFWGRKKTKQATPERSATGTEHGVDDFVVVNNSSSSSGPQHSMYPTSQSNNDYESLFSYLRVTETQVSNGGNHSQPVRPAPPAPSAYGLPYPIHRASFATAANEPHASTSQPAVLSYASAVAEQSTSAYYLTGIPFQLSKSFGDSAILSELNKDMHIKSPNLSECEYSFSVEMEVIQESSPTNLSPTN